MRRSTVKAMTKTWLITGAGRGMGVEFARAALAAGHNVVATGRNPDTVRSAVGEHENLLVDRPRRDRPSQRRGRRGRCRRPLRPHRRAAQQRRQLPCRLLRGAHDRAGARADRDQPVRPDDGDPGGAAGDAQAALRPGDLDLLGRRRDRQPLRLGLRGVEVRAGGLDGVADRRGRAVRDPHDDRGARLLPHRAADARVDHVRRAVDRRLRRGTSRRSTPSGRR